MQATSYLQGQPFHGSACEVAPVRRFATATFPFDVNKAEHDVLQVNRLVRSLRICILRKPAHGLHLPLGHVEDEGVIGKDHVHVEPILDRKLHPCLEVTAAVQERDEGVALGDAPDALAELVGDFADGYGVISAVHCHDHRQPLNGVHHDRGRLWDAATHVLLSLDRRGRGRRHRSCEARRAAHGRVGELLQAHHVAQLLVHLAELEPEELQRQDRAVAVLHLDMPDLREANVSGPRLAQLAREEEPVLLTRHEVHERSAPQGASGAPKKKAA
mmetsp:Transcript_61370/g.190211  ORF Transcript_61370/g.190211 Transcript_61370/m.190211 type:complete len:273 (+) Transcript_61370:49-867(+)